MKMEQLTLMPVIRLGSAISKLPGGHDLIFFQKDKVVLRSYSVGVDLEIPGMDLTATVSAKSLSSAVKNMDAGGLDIRLTKTQMVITDGVRKARLKLMETGDALADIQLPEDMANVPVELNMILSRAVMDGGGNDGIQFLEELAVSKGRSELVISTVEDIPPFYLQKAQVELLQSAAISDASAFAVSDNMVYFHDPGHCTIRCASAVIPGAVTKENMVTFQEEVLAPAEVVYAGVMHESVGTVLKRVMIFSAVDDLMGAAVRIVFDPEAHIVKLIGENSSGAFEEVTDMEYDGEKPLDILISSTSLTELANRPFSIKQRPDNKKGIWFVAKEGVTTYICAGTVA